MRYFFVVIVCFLSVLSIAAQTEQDETNLPPDTVNLIPLHDVNRIGLRYTDDGTIVRHFGGAIHSDAEQGFYAWVIPYLGTDATTTQQDVSIWETVRVADTITELCRDVFQWGFGHGDGNANEEAILHEFIEGEAILQALDDNNVVYDDAYQAELTKYIEADYNFQFMIFEKPYDDYNYPVYLVYDEMEYTPPTDGTLTLPLAIQQFHHVAPFYNRVTISHTPQVTIEGYPVADIGIGDYAWKNHPLGYESLGRPEVSGFAFVNNAVNDEANLGKAVLRYAGMHPRGDYYLTSFDTRLMPDQAADWEFVSAPDAPDFTEVDLADQNQIYLHQCTTETAATPYPEIADDLPSERTFFEMRGLSGTAIHPEGWQMSGINLITYEGDPDAFIVAPQAVTEADIEAFGNGDATPPMLVVMQRNHKPLLLQPYADILNNSPRQASVAYPSVPNWTVNTYAWDEASYGIRAYWLITDEQYSENPAMYDAMLRHFETYRYWLHPDLEHSIFIEAELENEEGYAYLFPLLMGYPDGLHPNFDAETVSLTLSDDDGNPQVNIETVDWSAWTEAITQNDDGSVEYNWDLLQRNLGIGDAGQQVIKDNEITNLCSFSNYPDLLIPITVGTQSGYLTVRQEIILVYPTQDAIISDETVLAIAETVNRIEYPCL